MRALKPSTDLVTVQGVYVPDMPLISAYTLYLAGLLSFNYKMMQSNAFCGKFTPLDLAYLAILKVNCQVYPREQLPDLY